MERISIKELTPDTEIISFYIVKNKQVFQKKNGEPYLRLTLGDKTGEIQALMWDNLPSIEDIKADDLLKLKGRVNNYQGKLQITIQKLEKTDFNEIDPSEFLPVGTQDPNLLLFYLEKITGSIKNKNLLDFLNSFLKDEEFLKDFTKFPAGKTLHHPFLGGLLEHTVSVIKICESLSFLYDFLDNDILITSAFLHDIGKIKELKFSRSINYSDEGKLLGHITLGIEMVDEKLRSLPDFPQELSNHLKHIILSHHGEYEYGSPKRPMTLEALILHYADNIDAKVNGFRIWMESKPDSSDPNWTEFWPLMERYLFRPKNDGYKE
ncbi:MAG: hypothetical protein A2149_08215 [Candidatus Schekmanbacteria bacterium RBG_16_38_11]|uniref:HD domain-containing protein n=1 Tax=Candidatus Schekmanbacteria bacterium RBG_16_38_11 TaxID=1817880 RepID=A0A1F7RX21_9BACT|nr:MAG: hypothetical protein A2149_08215 [Candidatus Schekmanbacteria bacterium RBG_16_38_11]